MLEGIDSTKALATTERKKKVTFSFFGTLKKVRDPVTHFFALAPIFARLNTKNASNVRKTLRKRLLRRLTLQCYNRGTGLFQKPFKNKTIQPFTAQINK